MKVQQKFMLKVQGEGSPSFGALKSSVEHLHPGTTPTRPVRVISIALTWASIALLIRLVGRTLIGCCWLVANFLDVLFEIHLLPGSVL